jgi:pSer/pThr/pTyr-binding forkhead associated (FHA) protein
VASSNGGEPRLIGTQGAYAGTIFPLKSDSATLGREEMNAIPLPQDATTSRRHATIFRENGGFAIRDEGSSNGTFVNGVRINSSQALRPGDEVQVGSSRFRFEAS